MSEKRGQYSRKKRRTSHEKGNYPRKYSTTRNGLTILRRHENDTFHRFGLKKYEAVKDGSSKSEGLQSNITFQDFLQELTSLSEGEILDTARRSRRTDREKPNISIKELSPDDLPFNVRQREAPNCSCSHTNVDQWAIHGVFQGEKDIPKCCPGTNNADKLWCYRLSISPTINFMAKNPTVIKHAGHLYNFDGFFLLSHYPLEQIPPCTFVHYHREYTVCHESVTTPANFCIKDLDLFQKYVFEELLEIYDWKIQDHGCCQHFHFIPRFIRADTPKGIPRGHTDLPEKGAEAETAPRNQGDSNEKSSDHYRDKRTAKRHEDEQILPINVVLEHLMKSYIRLDKQLPRICSQEDRNYFERKLCDSLVANQSKKPHCVRLDGLIDSESRSRKRHVGESCLMFRHFSWRSAKTSYLSNKRYIKLREEQKYIKRMATKRNAKVYSDRLLDIKAQIRNLKEEEDLKKRCDLRIPAKGMFTTGIKADITQHLISLHFVVDHIRYQKCLEELERRIEYRFKDRTLLQTALRHWSSEVDVPSSAHLKTAERNCGCHNPKLGNFDVYKQYKKEKGMQSLSEAMIKPAESEECLSKVKHNECLEFLGDAVLEVVASHHLFFLFGEFSEGTLNNFRSALVQNKYLTVIAKRIGLEHFMYFEHGLDDYSLQFDHMLGNCVEAILGAVYLDGGYEEVENLICKLLFEEEDLRQIWQNIPKHELQPFVKLEEAIGIEFKNICLLAKSMKHPSSSHSNLIGGSNQRLEFFGDSILKFLISDYLYKHFPNHQEGHLTLLRSSLINARVQGLVAEELGLQNYVICELDMTNFTTGNGKKLADTFEAFFAAVYVDQGMEYCKTICDVCFIPKLESFIVNQSLIDSKSHLQQCCSYIRSESNRIENPVYRQLEATGTAQNRKFRVGVYFRDERMGTGTGSTLQKAHMAAAEDALQSDYFQQHAKQSLALSRILENRKKCRTEMSNRFTGSTHNRSASGSFKDDN
eukprot:gene15708-17293_t